MLRCGPDVLGCGEPMAHMRPCCAILVLQAPHIDDLPWQSKTWSLKVRCKRRWRAQSSRIPSLRQHTSLRLAKSRSLPWQTPGMLRWTFCKKDLLLDMAARRMAIVVWPKPLVPIYCCLSDSLHLVSFESRVARPGLVPFCSHPCRVVIDFALKLHGRLFQGPRSLGFSGCVRSLSASDVRVVKTQLRTAASPTVTCFHCFSSRNGQVHRLSSSAGVHDVVALSMSKSIRSTFIAPRPSKACRTDTRHQQNRCFDSVAGSWTYVVLPNDQKLGGN